jgi:hypothetical protein
LTGGCPFKEHLYELEEEQEIVGQILFAVFQDTNGSWRALTISTKDKQVSFAAFVIYRLPSLFKVDKFFKHWTTNKNTKNRGYELKYARIATENKH